MTDMLSGTFKKCPKCGGTRVGFDPLITVGGYGPGLATCIDCSCLWEPFDPEQQLDAEEVNSSFIEPCNNCAFRPGSSEQADTQKWKDLMERLMLGGQFYCHKGVPITPNAEHGFDYPKKKVTVEFDGKTFETEVYEINNMRLCRGFLDRVFRLRAAGMKKVKSGKLDAIAIMGDMGE